MCDDLYYFSQVAKIVVFCEKLSDRLAYRAKGWDKSGSDKGTANTTVEKNMLHIRQVADLHQLAASDVPVAVSACLVRSAANRLAEGKLVPPSAVPSEMDIRAGLTLLRDHRTSTSQELWKLLVRPDNRQNLHIKAFADFVTRLWLLTPPESVVESMASVIGDVFGDHRQLDHCNAAQELVVRWNGPSVCRADRLLKRVQRGMAGKDTFRCVRRTASIGQAWEGTVISRHKKASDPKACLWLK